MNPEWDEFLEKEDRKVNKNDKLIDACLIGRANFRPFEEYLAKIDGRVLPPMLVKTPVKANTDVKEP
jgi:hypothetical protein